MMAQNRCEVSGVPPFAPYQQQPPEALNKLPELKAFLKSGEAESYRNVEVNFIHGKKAVLTIYSGESADDRDSWVEEEKVTLSDYQRTEEMHQLMLEKGSARSSHFQSEEELKEMRLKKAQEKADEEERKLKRKEEREKRKAERMARQRLEEEFGDGKESKEEKYQKSREEMIERNRRRDEMKQREMGRYPKPEPEL
ncbi:hypothetical protein THAOC_03323 [Thalassiosira oceanica]|uniref:Selenoprotein F/M domain-containing protein n=1 Tax=Thalassiosira oceanica TaxID=159749 RepID=K0TBU0_THAOC|nr:hypothetical protein THAOC_03323 [Thalassiosira oceanica]|eukprot:EJK74970.1 hypothetical protein THAOC_03323 [Thalassiosira oceanica]